MSLIACKECGKQVSDDAANCPHCGASVPKKTGLLGWIGAIALTGVVLNAVFHGQGSAPTPAAPDPHLQALAAVKLEHFQWEKGGFENIMIIHGTLQNTGTLPVRDIEITCDSYGNSGTVIDHNKRTLYETIPAGKAKRIKAFNMGFQHTQATRASCTVTNLALN